MIRVWGRKTSSNVQCVIWTLAELGLEHERIDAGGTFGGLDTPDFAAMNPNRRIPVLQDGPVTVWESAAVVRYLAARYAPETFWPAAPAARAPLDMWAEWGKQTWGGAVQNGLFWLLVRTPAAKRPAERVAALTEETRKLAGILDARLADGPWLGGADFTFADIMVGHLLYRYHTLEIERAEAPNLSAYYARLCERPAFAEHVMVSYEGLRVE